MKKLNNKAFTMIELIAAITIMAILMLIIIPNIFGVVDKNKKTTYLNDAKQLITMAKNQYESDPTITEPTDSLCLVFRLKDLRKSGLEKGPNGGKYNGIYSYVTINYNTESGRYVYGVQLLEQYTTKGKEIYRGIAYTKQADLQRNSVTKDTHSVDSYIDLSSLSVSSSCPNGLVFSDGSTSDENNNGGIGENDILKVTYKIGANVEEIGTKTGNCTVQRSKKSCEVPVPSVIPKEGYTSVGWSRTVGALSGDTKTIILNKFNSIYYANAIDITSPKITLSKEGDQEYTKEKQIDVKISDLGSGLDSGIIIKYGWSPSANVEPRTYTEVELEYEKGAKEVTFQATGDELNGDYYLWIVPIKLQDIAGKTTTEPTVSKGVFKYNFTHPICQFANTSSISVGNQETLLLTCTDDQVNVVGKSLTPNDFTISSDDNGRVVSVSTPKAIANGYEYQVTVEGIGTGNFSVTLPKDTIQNEAGNMNEDVSSPKISVTGRTYHVSYILDNNISGISGGDTSCTTSGKSLECEITLPTITPSSGYNAAGWYINNTDEVGKNGKYKIREDTQLYAKVKEKEYTVIYNYEENGGTSAERTNFDSEANILHVGNQFIEIATAGTQIIKKEENESQVSFQTKVQAKKEKEGWEFVGWNTDPNEVIGFDEYYMPNITEDSKEEITLYAIFRKEKTAEIHYYKQQLEDMTEETSDEPIDCIDDGSEKKCKSTVSCYIYNKASDDEVCNFTIPTTIVNSSPKGFNYVGLLADYQEEWKENSNSDLEQEPETDAQINSEVGENNSSEDTVNTIVYTSANSHYYAVYHTNYQINYTTDECIQYIGNINENTTPEQPGDSNNETSKSGIKTNFDIYLYNRDNYDNRSFEIKLPKIKAHSGYTNVQWVEIKDDEETFGNHFEPESMYTLTTKNTTLFATAEDKEKPEWTILYAEKDCNDNLKINIQGTDTSGKVESLLKLENLKVSIDNEEITSNIKLSEIPRPESPSSSEQSESTEFMGGTVYHIITLENCKKTGVINVIISESTLKDAAGNINDKTTLNYSAEIYDACESNEPSWVIMKAENDCDSLNIIIQGSSSLEANIPGQIKSSLTLEDLEEIWIGEENISQSTKIEKSLTKISLDSSENMVQYVLKLKGCNKEEKIRMKIKEKTLTDKDGTQNQVNEVSYAKEMIYNICKSTTP